MNYNDFYQESIKEPEQFWARETAKLSWSKPPTNILRKKENGLYEWFSDGQINMSRLCLEEQVKAGRGDQTAIIYDSPVTHVVQHISYHELLDKVSRFAGGLKHLGLQKGDTVIIYMPMIPEAVIAMLACARIGAIHSVVFGGFAPTELALRIDDARPKAIISTSYGIEANKKLNYKPLVDQALEIAQSTVAAKIFFQREENYDLLSEEKGEYKFRSLYEYDPEPALEVESTHPLYILYTSGTTSTPKGVVRDTGGYATALNSSMDYFYKLQPGDTILTASDIGWVVGHSYIVYGPLLYGATTILYEGKPVKTPDAGAFWNLVEKHKVKNIFTAPTAIRAIRQEDPNGDLFHHYDTSSLQQMFLAGERCDTATYFWLKQLIKKPVTDHCWQTESGWPMIGICTGIEEKVVEPGSAGLPVYGYNFKIINDEGEELANNEEGNLVVQLPLPPGCVSNLWRNEERFINGYFTAFPGYYLMGDGGKKDENGYLFITGRIDDIINVSGHRLSTATMEELVATHKDVAECAVIGIADKLKGQVPIGLVVRKLNSTQSEAVIEEELVSFIRNKIGPIACFKQAIVVDRLPKTRSGKILRKTICQIADGVPFSIPSTIDDPLILEEIAEQLARRKVGWAFTQ